MLLLFAKAVYCATAAVRGHARCSTTQPTGSLTALLLMHYSCMICRMMRMQANTGDWKQFRSFGAAAMRIPAGKQVLTVCFDDVSGFELESIAFAQQRTDAPATAKPVKATAKPTVVKPT